MLHKVMNVGINGHSLGSRSTLIKLVYSLSYLFWFRLNETHHFLWDHQKMTHRKHLSVPSNGFFIYHHIHAHVTFRTHNKLVSAVIVVDWKMSDIIVHSQRADTVCITVHHYKCVSLDKQLLIFEDQTCFEINTQVITTLGRSQLELLP